MIHSHLLLELQDQVASAGGEFWRQRAAADSTAEDRIEQTWLSLAGRIQPATQNEGSQNQPPREEKKRVAAIFAAASILAVACLLVWLGPKPAAAPPAWGWQASGVLAEDATAPDYLRNLAVAANDWFKKRPATAADLAIRIGQFRAGCSRIMLAEHRPLAEADQQWLVDRCRVWAGKLDGSLIDTESGRSIEEVRGEVDETVRRLISALETRADELSVN